MERRIFLATGAATLFGTALPLSAGEVLAYQPGLVSQRLDAGETVFLDFKASWCSTCRAQARQINALKDENPAYGETITFIDVDWDHWKRADITRRLNVPRRSTLILLRGNQELGRIIAGTSRRDIKALMDKGLVAA